MRVLALVGETILVVNYVVNSEYISFDIQQCAARGLSLIIHDDSPKPVMETGIQLP